jgi:hypothetical protein
MKLFYTSSYAIALLSLVGSLLVSRPVLAQISVVRPENQSEVRESTNTSDQNENIETSDSSNPEHTGKEYIQGYACYSSPTSERIPTTYAIAGKDGSQPNYVPIIRWTSTTFEGSGYPPELRCQIVSDRLDQLLKKGILVFMEDGTLRDQDVIFAASERFAYSLETFEKVPVKPNDDNLIITLEPQEDSATFLETFVSVLKAETNPIERGASRGLDWVKIPKEINIDEVLTEIPLEIQNLEVQDSLEVP